ncbi:MULTISPECIES: hypothetical protein [unclassified Streptomyces]|uniref:hypothetical protein n=1 Tax=unclassified Streptomyces TaxID=2593676 RepID=UPI002E77ABEE|nr:MULTISPECIES: hypothetical protein [unclassified Streptomyces]MEE1765099.1 hypothetical protein [Streptomyces sp. SP18BB07]MEE1837710.1 hypothetical protein [Streptomyces sp. SP17KL33]
MSGTDEAPAVFRCHVVAEDAEALREFIKETRPDTGCRPVARPTATGLGLDLYFRQDQLDSARSARSAPRVHLTTVENITENWHARKQEVGEGDRFAARGAVPRGFGRKE